MGFGQYQNYDKVDMDINYAWEVDGKRSDWHYLKVMHEKMEDKDKW